MEPEQVEAVYEEAKGLEPGYRISGATAVADYHSQVMRLCVEYVEERLHWLTYSENAVKEIPAWQSLLTKIKESNHAQRTKRSKEPVT